MGKSEQPRPFLQAELLRAESLHKQGLQWDEVAERIGHSAGSLTTTRSNIRRGKRSAPGQTRFDRDLIVQAHIEELVSLGARPKEIAGILKFSPTGLANRFSRWGLDREMRVEIRLADGLFNQRLKRLRDMHAFLRKNPLSQTRVDAEKLFFELIQTSELRHKELDYLVEHPQAVTFDGMAATKQRRNGVV